MEYKAGMWVKTELNDIGKIEFIKDDDIKIVGNDFIHYGSPRSIEPINIKIALSDDMEQRKRESEAIQKRAFEHGVQWADGSKVVKYTKEKYLYLRYSGNAWCKPGEINFGRNEDHFLTNEDIELTPSQYLGEEVEEKQYHEVYYPVSEREYIFDIPEERLNLNIPIGDIARYKDYGDYEKYHMKNRQKLIAECHQDHSTNRAMAQDELGYQPRPTIKFKCPYCDEKGSKEDIKAHLKRVYSEHPPSDNSPVWLKWMV